MDPQGLWLGVEIAAPMALVVAVDSGGALVDTRRVLQAPNPENVAAACQVLAARWSTPVRGLGLCAEDLLVWRGFAPTPPRRTRAAQDLAAQNLRAEDLRAEDLRAENLAGEGLAVPAQLIGPGTARALAEVHSGALQGAQDALVVQLGWTLQAGVLRAGQPWRGADGAPLEPQLAHLAVEVGGELCACGARGCLKTWLSEAAWQARAQAARLQVGQHRMLLHQPPVQTALLEGADLGDAATAQLLAHPLELLARATAQLAAAFSVRELAVQWPLSEPPGRLHAALATRLRQLRPGLGRVVSGQHGAVGSAWGAALWAQGGGVNSP